jgi:predicted phosphoadenosine phosphosulfate sulfurtransferase
MQLRKFRQIIAIKMAREKIVLSTNVYEESLNRIRYLYKRFDEVVVSFSGGKDSTVVLNCTIEVARELNRLPVKAVFFDEEAIDPDTIDYVNRVRQSPDVNLEWYCLEVKHRNAASNEEPWWYTWEKGKEDIWVRPMPEWAISHHPRFVKGQSFQDFSTSLYPITKSVAMLTGIRTEESLRRFRVINMRKNDSYINNKADNKSNQYRCHPIYDWSSDDVWIAVTKFGWDYNKHYDVLNKTDYYQKWLGQRVCPPFGEEPLKKLWHYKITYPDLWNRMCNRVKGASTAARYSKTELYSGSKELPIALKSWQEYVGIIIDSYEHDSKQAVKNVINTYIKHHYKLTETPIDDITPNPLSGISWKGLCTIALRGDFKGRKSTSFLSAAIKEMEKNGLSREDVIKKYAK